jgi:protocatechuate 3,4-dioxygenase beta subunit
MRSLLVFSLIFALTLLSISAAALNKLPPPGEEEVVREARPVTIWVVDADDEPVASAEVRLHSLRDDLRGTVRGEQITDAMGIATFEEVPVGRWAVSVRGEDHRCDGVEFDVPPTGEPPLVEVPLNGRGRVTGRVVDTEGQPVEGLHVVARRDLASERRFRVLDFHTWDRTDEGGFFELSGLLEGDHTIIAWTHGNEEYERLRSQRPVEVQITARRQAVELEEPLQVRRREEIAIWGQVVDTGGNPVEGAEITLLRSDGRTHFRGSHIMEGGLAAMREDQPRVRSDAMGQFHFSSLHADRSVAGLAASAEDGRIAVLPLLAPQSGRVDSDRLRGPHRLVLTEGVMIQGRVLREGAPFRHTDAVAVALSPQAAESPGPHVTLGMVFHWFDRPNLQGDFELGPVPRGTTVLLGTQPTRVRGPLPLLVVPLEGDPPFTEIDVGQLLRPLRLVVHVVDAATGEPIPNALIQSAGRCNGTPIIGLMGEPVTLSFAGGIQGEPWIGAVAEGYTMHTLEGLPAEPWVEPVRPGMDRTPHRGWQIPLPPEDMTEVRILMTRE